MRRDGDHGDLTAGGTVTPKDAIRAWRAVLGVRLKHLFMRIERVLERAKLVGLQARVSRVFSEQGNAFVNLLEKALITRGFGSLRAGLALE